jgi:ABC-type antimicrobial peptide transport system permease subunit
MLLAVIGIYGVIAYSVEQRKRELGVRLALGSSQSRVVRLVLRDCMAMAALGVLAGIVGTAWSASLLKTLLFNVSSGDVAAYSAAIGVILLATLVAGLIPAWRASRIDPVAALRSE